jgi:hypothetical protein
VYFGGYFQQLLARRDGNYEFAAVSGREKFGEDNSR